MTNGIHLIDCDGNLSSPQRNIPWEVTKHEKGGIFKWDPARIELVHPRGFFTHLDIGDVIKEFSKQGKVFLNDNVLEYLLKHKDLVPKEWMIDANKTCRSVFFLRPEYRAPNGRIAVRCLQYGIGSEVVASYDWLDNHWSDNYYAAVLRAE